MRELAALPEATVNVTAKVPGAYELDLQAAGILPNLYFGKNWYAARKFEGHQWLYSRTFDCPEVAKDERVFLEFDGLDTLCDIFMNGQKVGEAEDMFIPHEFNVTKHVTSGAANRIDVLFRAPAVESQFNDIAPIGNAGSSSELECYRKPSHMIGWDIIPRFMSAGIFRDVRLALRKPERIRDFFNVMTSFDAEKRNADYCCDIRLEGAFRRLDNSYLVLTVSRNGKTVVQSRQNVVKWTPRIYFSIRNADLWWPRGFGESALYDVKLDWFEDGTDKLLATKSRRLGVKKVDFDNSDYVDSKHPGEFLFTVNGHKCFIRGTSWVPTDAFHSKVERIVPTLELIKEANCNMIRVWGGGMYEPEVFWDYCDKNGIMVWQDFCFACTMYPQNNAKLLELMRHETIEVVKRLRNHASLALWCGNNENDAVFRLGMWRMWNPDPNADIFSRSLLPNVLREFDPTHPYLPSSPFINKDVTKGAARSVEGHYYRRWWKGELFTDNYEKFYSEIGLHGCPSLASIKEMMPEDSWYPFTSPAEKNVMWPVKYAPFPKDGESFSPKVYISNELLPGSQPKGCFEFNDQWTKHAVIVFEKLFGRSKYDGCRNHRMILQMNMLFGDIELGLEDFILQSQSAQAEGMKFFVEHFRSRKFAKKTGMTWWNMRDGWPVISDAVVDYYGRRKLAFDYIKRSQQTVLLMVDENADILVVNDCLKPVKGHVTMTDVASGKTLFDGAYACDANAAAKAGAIKLAGQGVVKIRHTVDGDAATYDNHYLYGGPTSKFVGEKKIRFTDYKRWMKGLYGKPLP